MDSSLRIIICLLKIPTTNATRVSPEQSFTRLYVQILAFNISHFLFFLRPTEPPGAFLQAAELCHPVWHVQPLLPRGTMWTVLQSLQQGTRECVYATSSV